MKKDEKKKEKGAKTSFISEVRSEIKKEKNVLEGAKVISFDGQKAYVQEIYVGLEFTLEDILENKINRNAIGVKNLDVFKSKYEKLGATGVIYFPEIDKYEFLEAGDIVIPWVSHENVEKSSRNLPKVKSLSNGCLNVFDLILHNKVFLAKDAVAKIEEVLA